MVDQNRLQGKNISVQTGEALLQMLLNSIREEAWEDDIPTEAFRRGLFSPKFEMQRCQPLWGCLCRVPKRKAMIIKESVLSALAWRVALSVGEDNTELIKALGVSNIPVTLDECNQVYQRAIEITPEMSSNAEQNAELIFSHVSHVVQLGR